MVMRCCMKVSSMSRHRFVGGPEDGCEHEVKEPCLYYEFSDRGKHVLDGEPKDSILHGAPVRVMHRYKKDTATGVYHYEGERAWVSR